MNSAVLEQLQAITGPKGWTTDPDVLQPHLTEWRNVVHGRTPVMLSPDSTEQVAEIVKLCAANGIPLVPQGGNTGMCAAAVPDDSGRQIILSLSRLNALRSVDADDYSLVAEAGCILANVQDAATGVDRLFALSLGAEGSCQIGGNIATNAGGINVIRYGTARAQVLGLEVVLPDGRVWNGLRSLRKNTAGYDLKQLFIGSEGTLGIITAACLRLFPLPGESTVALLGLNRAEDATSLLGVLREQMADRIQAFELIADRPMRWVEKHISGARQPFSDRYPWYVLIETTIGGDTGLLQDSLEKALDSKLIANAVIAKSDSEAESLWRLRHSISEAERHEGACLKHDIAVPIGKMATFLQQGDALLAEICPDARLIAFGHVGDGNLHYNVAQPSGADAESFLASGGAVSAAIYDLVMAMGGSISAEHGIGVLKRAWFHQYCDPVELELMQTLKKTLDPCNILNPGKVI